MNKCRVLEVPESFSKHLPPLTSLAYRNGATIAIWEGIDKVRMLYIRTWPFRAVAKYCEILPYPSDDAVLALMSFYCAPPEKPMVKDEVFDPHRREEKSIDFMIRKEMMCGKDRETGAAVVCRELERVDRVDEKGPIRPSSLLRKLKKVVDEGFNVYMQWTPFVRYKDVEHMLYRYAIWLCNGEYCADGRVEMVYGDSTIELALGISSQSWRGLLKKVDRVPKLAYEVARRYGERD
ncbi:MAG: hypothetical protein ABGW50_02120 [Thermococcus sp.]